jgi:hypothetical protein
LGVAGGLYWETLLNPAHRHSWVEATRALPIVRTDLGADAGLIGSAALATIHLPQRSCELQSRP